MYRTDKQFMTNPATATSRIYIGSIPKTVVAADLEEKFRMHGNILGLVLQMGFAFIQFENEAQAQIAIQNEHQTVLHGRKIIVKQALGKSDKNQNQNQQFQNKKPPLQMSNPPHNQFDKPKPLIQQQQNQQQHPQNQQHQQHPKNQQHPQNQQQPQNLQHHPQNQQKSEPEAQPPPLIPSNPPMSKNAPQPLMQEETMPPKGDGAQLDKRGKKRRMRNMERFQSNQSKVDMYNRDEYYGRQEESYPPAPYNAPPVIDQPPVPDRNDCEIIVVSKPLTKYAEYIEQRLKNLGLIVDLLFPNEDVPIGRVLANISSRGCLFAILVMPQNEEHRSLTLNVLHGIPQEHRNMPLEDALILITRNFDAYMRGDKTAIEIQTPGQMRISDRHPTAMQLILNLLAENRQITTSQYDKLMKYLQERRELQSQHEVTEGADPDSQEPNTKQTELQNRIMNILNKSAETVSVSVVTPAPVVTSEVPLSTEAVAAPPPLLKDPSVQKALDSLLGGEMFKNITTAL